MDNETRDWVFIAQDDVSPYPKVIRLSGTHDGALQKVSRLYSDTHFFQYSATYYDARLKGGH